MEEIPAKVMTINEIFDSIESESIGILPATRAYTILTHFDDLLKEGVIARFLGGSRLKEYIRLSIGTDEENKIFIAALKKVLNK